jgi:hypothetical protein
MMLGAQSPEDNILLLWVGRWRLVLLKLLRYIRRYYLLLSEGERRVCVRGDQHLLLR